MKGIGLVGEGDWGNGRISGFVRGVVGDVGRGVRGCVGRGVMG